MYPDTDDSDTEARNAFILVVDDDVEFATLLSRWLHRDGHRVVVAHDGAGAAREALAQHPDLVLLDLGMPGEDGFEVLKQFHANARLRRIPLVVLSGDDQRSSRIRALKLGARSYLQKWMTSWELRRAILEVLEDSRCAVSPI